MYNLITDTTYLAKKLLEKGIIRNAVFEASCSCGENFIGFGEISIRRLYGRNNGYYVYFPDTAGAIDHYEIKYEKPIESISKLFTSMNVRCFEQIQINKMEEE